MKDGMEVEQYMKFRDTLTPASGFQSAQYRLIEFASTELINLIDFRFRATIDRSTPFEHAFEHLYWQAAGKDHTAWIHQGVEVELPALVLTLEGACQGVEGREEQYDPEQGVPDREGQGAVHGQIGDVHRTDHVQHQASQGGTLPDVQADFQAKERCDLTGPHGWGKGTSTRRGRGKGYFFLTSTEAAE